MIIDMIIQNAYVYNSFSQSFEKKDVAIQNGVFVQIADHIDAHASSVFNAENRYMIPGLVDIHMHIESSMSIPSRFSNAVLPFGTTTVVADPHEIANVFGLEGIQSFLSNATTLDIFYGIPSSVPSTNEKLETTGGKIGVEEVKELLKDHRIRCLGEVMNFHDICYEENSLSNQIIKTCKESRFDLPIEGHCPKISGEELSLFISKGISADHTHQTSESVIEKIGLGMFLEIQKKSMSKEVIQTLIDHNFYDYFAFVTDDVMADRLLNGHLNELVQLAVQLGMPFEKAIYCATFTPSRRMHLEDRGAICPGRIADFILLDDCDSFKIHQVYKNGKLIQEKKYDISFPGYFYHSIQCEYAKVDDFKLTVKGKKACCNVIEIEPHSTFTKQVKKIFPIQNNTIDIQEHALLTVFERYGKNGNIAHAIIGKAIHKRGAIATSWAHDHHNVMVLGNHEDDMMLAQHTLVNMQGGFVVVENNRITATCPLEIGGIVSARDIKNLGSDLKQVREAMQRLGYYHDNEIMSISTLSLPVSPMIKVSDVGMIDTKKQTIIPLVEEVYED